MCVVACGCMWLIVRGYRCVGLCAVVCLVICAVVFVVVCDCV